MRPEIGTQAHFRKAKPPAPYRYDTSLSPEMDWDGENPARELPALPEGVPRVLVC